MAVVEVASSGCSKQAPHHQREAVQLLVGKKERRPVAVAAVGNPVDVVVLAVVPVLVLHVEVVCPGVRHVVRTLVHCGHHHRRTLGQVRQ